MWYIFSNMSVHGHQTMGTITHHIEEWNTSKRNLLRRSVAPTNSKSGIELSIHHTGTTQNSKRNIAAVQMIAAAKTKTKHAHRQRTHPPSEFELKDIARLTSANGQRLRDRQDEASDKILFSINQKRRIPAAISASRDETNRSRSTRVKALPKADPLP